jgi:hypothetical protein
MFIDQRADSKWRVNIEGMPLSQVVQKVQKVHKNFWKDVKGGYVRLCLAAGGRIRGLGMRAGTSSHGPPNQAGKTKRRKKDEERY